MNRQCWLRFLFFSSVLLTVSCSKLPPEQAHFAKGYSAYNKGDFTTAILYLKPLVEAENPAAQLLMARMYANGEGVPVDIGKSEFLRNSAAIQIFKKRNITPGEMDPMGNTLTSLSRRLDYYVNGVGGNEAPVKDLSDILRSLDIRNVADLQNRVQDQEERPSDNLSAESSGASSEISEAVHSLAPDSSSVPSPSAAPSAESSRGSDQISLGILRQAAESGDPTAMEFLSAAYAHGFYRLKPDLGQAGLWADKARHVRQRTAPMHDSSAGKIPVAQLALILGIGISLVGFGAWLWRTNASR